ncbi:MAG: GAF domain-containing protein [Anaerolineae bacterium]
MIFEGILDHLTRTAVEHGRTALWAEALPWIVEICGAVGGQILVDLAAPVRCQHGQIDSAQQRAIAVWETDLLWLENWMPLGSGSLTNGPPARPAASQEQPIAHIPIYEGRTLVGGLSLIFSALLTPDSPAIAAANALTQTLASLATLASERYHLQRRLTQSSLLYDVSRVISSSLEIDDVLKFTTKVAANALGAEGSALLLVDQKTNEVAFVIVHGEIAFPWRGQRAPLGSGVIGLVVRTGQPQIVNQISTETIFASPREDDSGAKPHTMLCAPLQVKEETLGVLLVLNREGGQGFNAEDLDWLTALAGQASVAIENARLYSSLREERDRILQAEEDVRHHLARNLHDSAAQLMGSLLMHIEVARKLALSQPAALAPEFDLLRELAQQANQELRQALLELRPLLLESRGLIGALHGYINQQRRQDMVISMAVEGTMPELANKPAETAIYLVVREAVANVRKHANAQNTWLRVYIQPTALIVEIEDDGEGMAEDQTGIHYQERGRMGVLTMRERVHWLGGKISFTSRCEPICRGTLVRIELPLARLVLPTDADTASWVIATQNR